MLYLCVFLGIYDPTKVKNTTKANYLYICVYILFFKRNLINIITKNGKYLVKAIPLEFSIGNMVRRILQIIREEYTSELKNNTDETDTQESLHKILTAEGDQEVDFNISIPSLKSAIIEHINEFEVELETWLVLMNNEIIRNYVLYSIILCLFLF